MELTRRDRTFLLSAAALVRHSTVRVRRTASVDDAVQWL